MNEKLKPCPFCGKMPKILEITKHEDKSSVFYVRCEHCNKMIQKFGTREEVINAWNSMCDGDVPVLILKPCPVCNHTPFIIPLDLDDKEDETAYMVGCPRCRSKLFMTDTPQKAQLLWNSYSEEMKSKSWQKK